MPVYIGLLRGINVGGKNKLPMKALSRILEQHNCTNIQTYIQSGNVIFEHPEHQTEELAEDITQTITQKHGFSPDVLIITVQNMKEATDKNPYPNAKAEPKSLHLFFLKDTPENPDIDALNTLKAESESFALINNVLYLHAPEGIGRSKLAAQAEKKLGVSVTARNWNTINKLLEMAGHS